MHAKAQKVPAVKFAIRHAKCDLYIAERAGSWARWGTLEEAMLLSKAEWSQVLNPDRNKKLYVFVAR